MAPLLPRFYKPRVYAAMRQRNRFKKFERCSLNWYSRFDADWLETSRGNAFWQLFRGRFGKLQHALFRYLQSLLCIHQVLC